MGDPGEGGQAGADERDEPPEEDGTAAALGRECLGVRESVLVPAERSDLQDPWTEVSTDLVADGVTEDRGEHDHPHLAARSTCPRLAETPPSTAAASPGRTKPTNRAPSANTARQ